ncbi:MAG: dihydrodipicolinate synthase family protein, partial [Granulosicoccus sp.]
MTPTIDRNTKGVFIIAATPFTESGALDLESTDRLLDFYLECGVDGVTILGVMGEAPKLSGAESYTFTRHVLKRIDNRVPVVVGVSSAGLDNMSAIVKESMDSGAAGVMVAPSPGLATEVDVKRYFSSVT